MPMGKMIPRDSLLDSTPVAIPEGNFPALSARQSYSPGHLRKSATSSLSGSRGLGRMVSASGLRTLQGH